MTFRVGQKVVCVKRDAWRCELTGRIVSGPPFRAVLEIDGFDKCGGLLFHQWQTDFYRDGSPRGYNPARFRPVTERKTDISIFKAMLTPQGVDA